MNNDSDWELTIENIFSLKPEYSKKKSYCQDWSPHVEKVILVDGL